MALTVIDLKNALTLLHRVKDISFGPECTAAAVLHAKITAEIEVLEAAAPPPPKDAKPAPEAPPPAKEKKPK